jgi:predicted Zn-dependent protease
VVTVSEEIPIQSPMYRQILMRHLAYLIVARSGLFLNDLGVSTTSDTLDDVGITWLVSKIENRLTIPLPALIKYLSPRPEAGNFDVACEFLTSLEIATARLVDLAAGTVTTRYEKGGDRAKVRNALEHSTTRLRLIGTKDVVDYIDRDPFILADPLFDDQSEQTMNLLQSQACKDGYTVDLLIRREASEDLQAIVSNTPLKTSRDVVAAIRLLPGGYAVLAEARLYAKLGLSKRALDLLTDAKWENAHLESEALALLARIARVENPGVRGLRRAVELNRAALRLDPANLEARFGLASTLTELGKPKAALDILEPLKWTANDSHARFYYTATAFMKMNEPALAKQALEALVMRRGHPYAKRGLGRLAKIYTDEHNEKRAFATYQQLFRMRPFDMKATKAYVQYLLGSGRTREALDQVLQVAQCAPLQPFCAAVLANEYANAGNAVMAESLRNESRELASFWLRQGFMPVAGD